MDSSGVDLPRGVYYVITKTSMGLPWLSVEFLMYRMRPVTSKVRNVDPPIVTDCVRVVAKVSKGIRLSATLSKLWAEHPGFLWYWGLQASEKNFRSCVGSFVRSPSTCVRPRISLRALFLPS